MAPVVLPDLVCGLKQVKKLAEETIKGEVENQLLLAESRYSRQLAALLHGHALSVSSCTDAILPADGIEKPFDVVSDVFDVRVEVPDSVVEEDEEERLEVVRELDVLVLVCEQFDRHELPRPLDKPELEE